MRKQKGEAKMDIQFDKCKEVVFHFNTGFLKDPTIPMWVIKTKGTTYYVDHVNTSGVPWSTKETPNNAATKGSLKFKNVRLQIVGGEAIIEGIG